MLWEIQKYDPIHDEFTPTGELVRSADYQTAMDAAKPKAAALGLGQHWCLT